jgi:hypothetical protein
MYIVYEQAEEVIAAMDSRLTHGPLFIPCAAKSVLCCAVFESWRLQGIMLASCMPCKLFEQPYMLC